MMVLGKFEREILIALLTLSRSLVVAAVWLRFTLLQLSFCLNLSPACTLTFYNNSRHSCSLFSLSPFILSGLKLTVSVIIDLCDN